MSVEFPEGVTAIGPNAFSGCGSLAAITLPDSVASIGNYAFYRCPAVRYCSRSSASALALTAAGYAFVDPEYPLLSFKTYEDETGMRTFTVADCDVSAVSVKVPDSVTSIGNDAFSGCSSLAGIVLPDSITSIGSYAFYNCSSLTAMTLPDSVTSIGQYAFSGCPAVRYCSRSSAAAVTLTSAGYAFTDPEYLLLNLKTYEDETGARTFAVADCDVSAVSVEFPEGTVSIEDSAFRGCGSLKNISVPDSVTSIGNYAFSNCSSLTGIAIPEGVSSIGGYAFYACYGLTSISLPRSVASVGNNAFSFSGINQIAFFNDGQMTFGSSIFNKKITVYCYADSEVETWAQENGYTIVLLDAPGEGKPLKISLPADMVMPKGRTLAVPAHVFPAYEHTAITWSSSAPEVVSVREGRLTAHAGGEAVITASCGDMSDTMLVTVEIALESFELPADEMWIVSGETAQMTLISVQPANATETVRWSSSGTSVSVSESGLISAQRPGKAFVTAAAENGFTRGAVVHVCEPVTAVTFAPVGDTIVTGGQLQLIAQVTAGAEILENRLVTFQSSNEAVAAVSPEGLVTALAYGTADIYAVASGGMKAMCSLRVICAEHDEVTDEGVAPTCTENGLTEGSHCGVCGELLTAQEVMPAAGHSIRFERDVCEAWVGGDSDRIAVEATCGHDVDLTVHVPDNLTMTGWDGDTVIVSGCEPGVAMLSAETDDEFRVRTSCWIIVHAAQQMTFPSALTAIGEEAFVNSQVEEVIVGSRVECIGARAFAGCERLALISLPDDVQITEDAFSGCGKLTILCTRDSTGHAYAEEHNIPYLIFDAAGAE